MSSLPSTTSQNGTSAKESVPTAKEAIAKEPTAKELQQAAKAQKAWNNAIVKAVNKVVKSWGEPQFETSMDGKQTWAVDKATRQVIENDGGFYAVLPTMPDNWAAIKAGTDKAFAEVQTFGSFTDPHIAMLAFEDRLETLLETTLKKNAEQGGFNYEDIIKTYTEYLKLFTPSAWFKGDLFIWNDIALGIFDLKHLGGKTTIVDWSIERATELKNIGLVFQGEQWWKWADVDDMIYDSIQEAQKKSQEAKQAKSSATPATPRPFWCVHCKKELNKDTILKEDPVITKQKEKEAKQKEKQENGAKGKRKAAEQGGDTKKAGRVQAS